MSKMSGDGWSLLARSPRFFVSFLSRDSKRRCALFASMVGDGAVVEQKLHDFVVALPSWGRKKEDFVLLKFQICGFLEPIMKKSSVLSKLISFIFNLKLTAGMQRRPRFKIQSIYVSVANRDQHFHHFHVTLKYFLSSKAPERFNKFQFSYLPR